MLRGQRMHFVLERLVLLIRHPPFHDLLIRRDHGAKLVSDRRT
jgi:hypothetical protein